MRGGNRTLTRRYPRDGALHHLSLPVRVCQIEGFGVSNVRYPQAYFNRLAMAVLEAEERRPKPPNLPKDSRGSPGIFAVECQEWLPPGRAMPVQVH